MRALIIGQDQDEKKDEKNTVGSMKVDEISN
jgi:hypothetical protein